MTSKKGFFFTVGVLLLLIPLIFLVSYYLSLKSVKNDDVAGKLRCNELHYFVEDLQRDLARATAIFGRRAVVYAVDHVVSSGDFIGDYVFNCTSGCGVNCSEFNVKVNGSEASLTELVLCGTLFGGDVPYMLNHTLSEWVDRMVEEGSLMNFNVSITVNEVKVIPHDAYSFTLILNLSLEISDKNGLCFFEKENVLTESSSSIIGLEDVLYSIKTGGDIVKYITNCSLSPDVENLAGSSGRGYGNGSGGGSVLFATDIPKPELDTYCMTHNVSGLILVITKGFGACNQIEQACFNASTPEGNHFEGVVDYGPDNPSSFSDKCSITIPWISDTDDMNLSSGECTFIKNVLPCGIHNVYDSISSNETNTSCYQVSDISGYLTGCDSLPNGPSFFDRLDGRLNLSEKYVNQSMQYYGTDEIGLETFVNPYELAYKGKTVFTHTTWVDYLYWQNISGCAIPQVCNAGDYPFNLDCAHTKYFRLDSSCTNGSNVEPSSRILYPTEGANLDCGIAPFNVSGNASDCDGSVSYVSVYLGAPPWVNATLNNSDWHVSWMPSLDGTYTIISKAADDKGLTEKVGFKVNVSVHDCGVPCPPACASCSEYCIALGGYASGTCRKNEAACVDNGEIHESDGDMYCIGGPSSDTCCCLPGETTTTTSSTTSTSTTTTTMPLTTSSTTTTSTSTTSTTSTTTTTVAATTSTINPPLPSCNGYCVSLGSYVSGTCRQNDVQCTNNGEVHKPGGDMYCTGGPSADTCCCKPT